LAEENCMEVISPELVLVDPELARAERARLVERARVAEIIDAEALRLAVARAIRSEVEAEFLAERKPVSTSAPRYRRYVLQTALLLGLLATGSALAVFVSGNRHQGTSQAAFVTPPSPTPPLSTSALSDVRPQGRRTAAAKAPRLPADAPTKAALEQRILLLIVGAPRAKLPADLVDPTTGLVKNNLQVVCRPARATRSFLCVARLAGERQARLLVRYRAKKGGEGLYTWLRGT
jgi:hypothetical protein